MKAFFQSLLIWLIYRLWSATWRVERIEPESFQIAFKEKKPFIIAHWHGDEMVLLHLIGFYRVGTMTSTSKDGELMDQVIQIFGGMTARGSSTRGAIGALKGVIDLVKKHRRNPSMAVDGPKGPIYQIKPGVFELSRLLQIPIYTAGISCTKSWIAQKSWNKAYLPLPFSRVVINWTGPFGPVSQDQNPRDPNLALELKSAFDAARQGASKIIAGDNAGC